MASRSCTSLSQKCKSNVKLNWILFAAAMRVRSKIERPASSTAAEPATFYRTLEVFLQETKQKLVFEAELVSQGALLLYLDGEEEQELAYAPIHHIYVDSGNALPQKWVFNGIQIYCNQVE